MRFRGVILMNRGVMNQPNDHLVEQFLMLVISVGLINMGIVIVTFFSQ
jgi:hypothetical protein